jgi:hypothetical protein
MAFQDYTIVPEDGIVVIDGNVANNVLMSGIPAGVHAIVWNGLAGAGRIEYDQDPVTGVLPAPGSFSDAADYSDQTDQAEAIIFAKDNPVTYYSTIDGNVYEGSIYDLGQAIIISTPNPLQPPDTTASVPPIAESWQQLYWYSDAWVVSSFDPTFSLSEAKNTLNDAIETSAAEQATLQSRIYSPLQLVQAVDPSALDTADYFSVTLGDYQIYLDGEVASMQAEVNAATTTPSLYSFDPTVDGNPNP